MAKGNMFATTIDNFGRIVSDNYTSHSELTKDLKANGRIRLLDGGANIREPIEFSNNGSATWYQGSGRFAIENNQFLNTASYQPKMLAVTDCIVGSEEIFNDGREAMHDLLKLKVSNMYKTLSNEIAAGVYSDGSDALQIGGLQYLVPEVNTQPVGGIDPTEVGNEFWKNYSVSKSITTANILQEFQTAVFKTTRNNDRIKAIYTDNSGMVKYESSLQAQQRFVDSSKGDGGFQNLSFHGIPVKNDQAMNGYNTATGKSHFYFINFDMLRLAAYSKRNPSRKPTVYSIDQDAKVETLWWAGNMVEGGRAFNGVITDTTPITF